MRRRSSLHGEAKGQLIVLIAIGSEELIHCEPQPIQGKEQPLFLLTRLLLPFLDL